MPKKPVRPQPDPTKIRVARQDISDTLETNYMPYAMSVIVSRAIPEIDGFKPAHRKLLYTMYTMGLLRGGRLKSADIVGQTMKLNPHGDAAIYETMVRLTRGNDALLHPFVDSKGSFGKHFSRDMAYAASRYTEAKLDAVCAEIFSDIEKGNVDFIDNYNGRMKEPVLLPTRFPNVLASPNQGIAVGMASSLPGFNLRELCLATAAYIKNPNVSFLELLSAPDFSTGGELIYNEKEMEQIYATGRGSFKLRAKWRFDKKNSIIEVYEIPYSTTIEAIVDKIVSLVKAGKFKEINDIRNETDLGGLKIAIDIKKAADPEQLMRKLFAATPLLDSFSCNFNILVDGRPRTMGVRETLDEWLRFRAGCVKRRVNFDLAAASDRLHLLQGLAKIILDIDKAIAIIRRTEEDALVIPNLMEGFAIDKPQAEFVAEIKLRNLNKAYLLGKTAEIDGLLRQIDELRGLLGDEGKIRSLIASELREIAKKHGRDRRTDIIHQLEHIEPTVEDFIEEYNARIFLTEHGYFKKIPLSSLRSSGEQFLKDDDRIVQEIEISNKDELLFFSSGHSVYKTKAHELQPGKASSMGDYLPNLLKLEDGEKITCVAAISGGDYGGFMLFGFENGKIAKVELSAYETKTNRKKLINAYSDKSPLVFAERIAADRDYIVIRDSDKALLFNTELLPSVGAKNSGGIQVFTLKKKSRVTCVAPADSFGTPDLEFYRTDKLPSAGHFMPEKDRLMNDYTAQMELPQF